MTQTKNNSNASSRDPEKGNERTTPPPPEKIKTPEAEEDAKREAIKTSSQQSRVDTRLGISDEKSHAEVLNKIDFGKTLEEQPEGVRSSFLFSVEHEVIPQLLNASIDPNLIIHLGENGNHLTVSQKVNELRQSNHKLFANWDLSTQTSFGILMEGAKGNAFGTSLFAPSRWGALVTSAKEKFKGAKALRDTPSKLLENAKEIPAKTLAYIKEHPKTTAAVVLGLIGTGLLIRFLRKRKKTDSIADGPNIAGKALKYTTVAAGAVGLLYVLSRILPGGDGARDWLAKLFGVEKAKELVQEQVKKGIEWLDNHLHFSEMKKKFAGFFDEYNLPVWMKEKFTWIKDMKLSDVAKDLGIDPENESSWKEYAVEGGAALMIYKWAGKKALLANAIPYLFFIREGRNSFGGKIVANFAKDFDQNKTRILASIKNNLPAGGEFIASIFENIRLEDKVNDFLDFLKDHKIESMAAFNGLWMCRALIWKALMALKNTVGDIGKFVIMNPGKAVLSAGGLFLAYQNRRRIAEELIKLVYDDPNSEGAKEMLKYFDEKLEIDRSKPESLYEKQLPAYAQSIIDDGWEAFKLKHVQEAWGKGKLAVAIGAGTDGLLFLKGVNVPIQAGKLAKTSAVSAIEYLSSAPGEEAFKVILIGGVETFIFGSMALEAARSYPVIYKSAEGWTKVGRMGLSVLPATNSWNFIFRSGLSGIPGVMQFMKAVEQHRISHVQKTLDEILVFSGEATPNFKKIEEISSALVKRHKLLKGSLEDTLKSLSGTRHGIQRKEVFDHVKETVQLIYEAAKAGKAAENTGSVTDIGKAVTSIEQLVSLAKTELGEAAAQTQTIFQKLGKSAAKLYAPVAGSTKMQHALHYSGRAIGSAAVLYSGYMAADTFADAMFTKDFGRSNILFARSATHAAEAGASVGLMAAKSLASPLLATKIGLGLTASAAVGGAIIGAGIGSMGAMAHNALDSKYENTKTSKEWAKEVSHPQLVHEWLSSSAHGGYGGGEYRTAGDAYRFMGSESLKKEHDQTRRKIVEALLTQEEGEANPDRMYFFEKVCNFSPPMQYSECLNLLRDSKQYAEIQKNRKLMRDQKYQKFFVGNIDILSDKYDQPNGLDILEVVAEARKNSIEQIPDNLKQIFSVFNNAYLLDLLEQGRENASNLSPEHQSFMMAVIIYLEAVRGVNPDVALVKRLEMRDKKPLEVNLATFIIKIDKLISGDAQYAFDEYKTTLTDTPACYSLYSLAQYFGYAGHQNEDELKAFFVEDRKGYFGIYWDGSEWVVNEQGMEFDNEIGKELNEVTINGFIKEFRNQSGNIFEHRHDSVFYSEGETMYDEQSKTIARILENGLKNYQKYGKPRLPELVPEKAPEMAARKVA